MEKEIVKVEQENTMQVFGSKDNFDCAQRMAKALSSSTIVPASYQGDKNLANCIIALEMANRMGASPIMVMQNLYIVHGQPGWSSKFLIATLNRCGRFTSIRYEQENQGTDKWRCRAYATEKATGETLYGSWVSLEMAKKEGWATKAGSKWQSMPELMLMYRAGAFFQRVYAPEIGMGLLTQEEIEDIPHSEVKEPTSVEQEIKELANTVTISAEEETKVQEAEVVEEIKEEPAKEESKMKAVQQETPSVFS